MAFSNCTIIQPKKSIKFAIPTAEPNGAKNANHQNQNANHQSWNQKIKMRKLTCFVKHKTRKHNTQLAPDVDPKATPWSAGCEKLFCVAERPMLFIKRWFDPHKSGSKWLHNCYTKYLPSVEREGRCSSRLPLRESEGILKIYAKKREMTTLRFKFEFFRLWRRYEDH